MFTGIVKSYKYKQGQTVHKTAIKMGRDADRQKDKQQKNVIENLL